MLRCIYRAAVPAVVAVLAVSASAADAPTAANSKKPIEINSDTLEVRQQENIAIFSGNVIAVQGDTRIRSNTMTVHYGKKEGEPAPAPATPPAGSGNFDPAQNKIERIDVDGNVVVTNPEESASGDKGFYNVDRKQIYLFGNVVLTRGKNILKGDTLVYDMATGKSVVNSPSHTEEGIKNGRVRALFMPEKKGSDGGSSSGGVKNTP